MSTYMTFLQYGGGFNFFLNHSISSFYILLVNTVQDLVEATKGLNDLYNLGKSLDHTVQDINAMLYESNMKYEAAKALLLLGWKKRDPDASLKKLAGIIESIGYMDLAEDIKRKHGCKQQYFGFKGMIILLLIKT